MSDNNKILDVTYGTFSCRLEGFENSVETMKTVVSFFHELAGHDRFMDTAPQAPDLDTLADLTSAQAGHPVEAEAETDGSKLNLRLRQGDDRAEHQERPSLRLRRPPADVADQDHAATENLADVAADPTSEAIGFDDADFESTDFDDSAFDADEFDDDDLDDAGAEMPAEETAPVADDVSSTESVAAKLQRIRAVVGAPPAPRNDDTYAEDSTDDAAPAPANPAAINPLAQRLAELAKRNAAATAEDESTDASAFDAPAAEDDAYMADETETFTGDAEVDTEGYEDAVTDAPVAEDTAPTMAPEHEDLISDTAPSADETPENFEAAEDGPADQMVDGADDAVTAADDNDDITVSEDDSEYETLAADDNHDDDFASDSEADEPDQAKSEADDLHEQVADVQRTLALRHESRSKRDELPSNVDAAMSRILSQTDQYLNEPEGRRHRDAFAQLRAAVAATEAGRRLGDDPAATATDPGDAFRNDLNAHNSDTNTQDANETDDQTSDEVPDADGPMLLEPASNVSPLRLVPAQRVDDKPAQSGGAADRLRQIATQRNAAGAKSGDFAEFAAATGAKELTDMLEAAAAYIAFVEGEDDFSRPQVMKKVQSASTEEVSREDGLRSFGRLLRQSRIIKLSNGRFQVSETTRFRPDDRAAEG